MNDANEFDPKADVFVADPADAEYFDEPMLPKWPIVVGTISIVLGCLFSLCGAMAPASSEQGALQLERLFLYALSWTVGGTLQQADRLNSGSSRARPFWQ